MGCTKEFKRAVSKKITVKVNKGGNIVFDLEIEDSQHVELVRQKSLVIKLKMALVSIS